jgi:hypothetical protein
MIFLNQMVKYKVPVNSLTLSCMKRMILIELEIKTWFWCIKNYSRNTQNINKTMEGCEEGCEYKGIIEFMFCLVE